MNRLFLTCICLIVSYSISFSQNLIPNESFEEVPSRLNRWMVNHTMFEGLMKDWLTPDQGTPDIFFNESIAKMSPVRKGVDLSPHQARTGEAMVGFKTYGCATFTQHCKEYLQAKLKAPIERGKQYYIEFYVQPYVHSIFTNNIGLAFSDVEIQDESEYGIHYLDPVVMEENIIANGPNQWHKISDTITADGNYEYVLIGNFKTDEDTKIKKDGATINYSYYLMDDVLVVPVHKTFENNFKLESVEVGKPVRLDNILFETGQATLQASSFVELEELANFLKNHVDLSIEIIGHTDAEGDLDANYKLSESRALAVLDELVKKGIDRERMDYIGFGEDKPIAGNDTEAGMKANRRVEFVIVD